jgi:hypothetical protein
MSKFPCSYDARKVFERLSDYGIELPRQDDFNVEMAVGEFFPNHVIGVIDDILKRGTPGNAHKKMAKIAEMGWAYFNKPVWAMLSARTGALRTNSISIEHNEKNTRIYGVVTASLLLADFNMDELRILCIDLPAIIGDDAALSNAIEAAKRQSARSIYYLQGILRREYQTTQGRIKEIQSQAQQHDKGWAPPTGFEEMDIVDRRELHSDWLDKLNSIKVAKALNDAKDT